MTKAQRKAAREIRALLKPLDKDEQLALVREITFKLEVEAIAQQLLRAIHNMPPRKKKP